jgi:hypothetical protein
MAEDKQQVNFQMGNDMAAMLDALVAADTKLTGIDMDRSKIMRRLIRQEFERRQKTGMNVNKLPGPEGAHAPILVGIGPCGDTGAEGA